MNYSHTGSSSLQILNRAYPNDFNISNIFLFFICGSFFVLISDVPNNWGAFFYIARIILALLLISTFILPKRLALLILLLLAITGQDIVSFGDYGSEELGYATASIWQMRLGPINPGALFFVCLFWQLLRFKKLTVPPFVRTAIVWFATVPVITALYYKGLLTEHAGIEVIVDIKFALMLIGSIILFLSFYRRDPNYLYKALAVFAGALLARHLMDLIYVIANIGPAIAEGVTRGSEDSAKGAVAFLLFLGLMLVWKMKRPVFGVLIVISSIILLITYGTRNLWVTTMLGFIVLILYLGFRRSFSIIIISIVLSMIGIWSLYMVNPWSADVVFARSRTLITGSPVEKFNVLVDYNLISRIDQVRYAQIFNVFDALKQRYAILWGTGYGGYYEDAIYPFPADLKSAFPDYSFETGKYYRTHQFSTHIILKHGLLGFVCIVALWFIPGYTLFKLFRQKNMFSAGQPKMIIYMMLCVAAFLPTGMFQTFWSGKGLFINGLIIASCMEFARHYPYKRLSSISKYVNDTQQ